MVAAMATVTAIAVGVAAPALASPAGVTVDGPEPISVSTADPAPISVRVDNNAPISIQPDQPGPIWVAAHRGR